MNSHRYQKKKKNASLEKTRVRVRCARIHVYLYTHAHSLKSATCTILHYPLGEDTFSFPSTLSSHYSLYQYFVIALSARATPYVCVREIEREFVFARSISTFTKEKGRHALPKKMKSKSRNSEKLGRFPGKSIPKSEYRDNLPRYNLPARSSSTRLGLNVRSFWKRDRRKASHSDKTTFLRMANRNFRQKLKLRLYMYTCIRLQHNVETCAIREVGRNTIN